MTKPDLATELFGDGRTAGIVVSHVDVELGDFAAKDKKLHHKHLDAFTKSLSKCPNLEAHTKNAISSGVIGVYWCETRQIAQEVIEDVYRRLLSSKKYDGYNCCGLNSSVGFIEIWVDR